MNPFILSSLSVPMVIEAVHCGFPSPAEDHHDERLDLEKRLIRHPAATFFVRSDGRSMEPLIYAGDILLVDRSLIPRDGDVVMAVIDGGFVVKRFHCVGGRRQAVVEKPCVEKNAKSGWILKSDNVEEGSNSTDGSEDVSIWGVISSIIRELHPMGS